MVLPKLNIVAKSPVKMTINDIEINDDYTAVVLSPSQLN